MCTNLKLPSMHQKVEVEVEVLGSVPASIHGFVRPCVRACVVSQFLVQDMTTIN